MRERERNNLFCIPHFVTLHSGLIYNPSEQYSSWSFARYKLQAKNREKKSEIRVHKESCWSAPHELPRKGRWHCVEEESNSFRSPIPMVLHVFINEAIQCLLSYWFVAQSFYSVYMVWVVTDNPSFSQLCMTSSVMYVYNSRTWW